MGLQVCEQPAAFLCSLAELGAWGAGCLKERVPLAWSCCKGWQSNSLAPNLSVLLQDIWTQRPVQTDRYRNENMHTSEVQSASSIILHKQNKDISVYPCLISPKRLKCNIWVKDFFFKLVILTDPKTNAFQRNNFITETFELKPDEASN